MISLKQSYVILIRWHFPHEENKKKILFVCAFVRKLTEAYIKLIQKKGSLVMSLCVCNRQSFIRQKSPLTTKDFVFDERYRCGVSIHRRHVTFPKRMPPKLIIYRQSSQTKIQHAILNSRNSPMKWILFLGPSSAKDREDRVRRIREQQDEERRKKLEELKQHVSFLCNF